jgi:hypothetical protein
LSLVTGELAVLAELLLRGPQQRGELRARASRMASFPTQEGLAEALASLERKGLVAELPPAPGGRAPRVAQLLTPLEAAPEARPVQPAAAPAIGPDLAARVAALEHEVARLGGWLRTLSSKLGEDLGSPG